jgi:hypothetical protein
MGESVAEAGERMLRNIQGKVRLFILFWFHVDLQVLPTLSITQYAVESSTTKARVIYGNVESYRSVKINKK